MNPRICKLSMADYLADPSFSQSMLKKVKRSPLHFRYAVDHPEKSTPEQIIGTVTHSAILEPDLLGTACWVRPETYENKKGDTKKWTGNAGECKDWLVAHEDRPVIRQNDFDRVMGMRESVLAHESAAAALKNGAAETCFFADDPETGLPLKCRTDWLSGNTIIDLKTTDDAREEAFYFSILKYGYDVQAAFNLDMAKWVGVPKDYFLFIAIEKDAPYAVAVYELSADFIEAGREKYRRYLSIIDHCVKTDSWPGYDPSIKSISLADWSKRPFRSYEQG